MSRVIKLILILVVALVGLTFYLRNNQAASFDYFTGTVELPFAVWLFVALVAGVALGVLALLPLLLRLKGEKARLTRQARLHEKELNNLRSLPLRDPSQ